MMSFLQLAAEKKHHFWWVSQTIFSPSFFVRALAIIITEHCALAGLFRSKKEKKLGHRHQPTAFKVHLKTFSLAFFSLCQH